MIVLVTDSTAYISAAEAAALGVMVLPMTYSVDAQAPVNERYVDDNGDFERLIRENPTTLRTSQVSFVRFQSAFEELRAAGHQILCMTISSRLSGTYGNAFNAARELPGDGIRVVDSLSTGGGLTLLLREARRILHRHRLPARQPNPSKPSLSWKMPRKRHPGASSEYLYHILLYHALPRITTNFRHAKKT